MSNNRLNPNFESALEKIGRTIGRNHGITVKMQGNSAYTDGKTIVLPVLEEVGDELKRDLNGFLDHEVAHCKYTKIDEKENAIGRFHEELMNAMEDTRIEIRLIQDYSGCALNLDPLNAKWQGKMMKGFAKYPASVKLVIALRHAFESRPLTSKQLEPIQRLYDAALPFIEDAKEILTRQYNSQADDYQGTIDIRIAAQKATEAIQQENEKIKQEEKEKKEKAAQKKKERQEKKEKAEKEKKEKAEKEKAEKEESEKEESEEKSDESESESDENGEESDSDGESESDSNDSEKSESKSDKTKSGATDDLNAEDFDEDEDDSSQGNEDFDEDDLPEHQNDIENNGENSGEEESEESEESNESNSDEDGEESESSEDGDSGEDEDFEDGDSETESETSLSAQKLAESLTEKASDKSTKKSDFDKQPISLEQFINNLINEEIKDAPDVQLKRGWYSDSNITEAISLPFTTEFDTVTNYSGKGNRSEYANRKREVMRYINPISSTLERVLVAQADEKFRFDRERGMIDNRSISRMITDREFRTPFKDFTRVETRDVAVELLIDLSGSMTGQKLEVAKRAVIALGEALMGLGMKFEVTGFHTSSNYDSNKISEMTKGMSDKDLQRFNRRAHETLSHYVFKDFDTQSLTGITEAKTAGANCDGESIKWAVQRLVQRPERRKILLVFSDGQPASGQSNIISAGDLLRTVNLIMKSGIEVVGFGIQTECVNKFYKDHVIIDDLNKLPTKVMSKVAKILENSAARLDY